METCLSVVQVSTVKTPRGFPKEVGPIPSRCLFYIFFLKPQTDGLTVKMRAKETEDAGNQLGESLWPSGMKPFDCVFQETKQKNLTHTQSCASHHKQVLNG